MQEMTQAIHKASDTFRHRDSILVGDPPSEMLEASFKWARTSLEVFSGEALRKAMLLAAAMADFAHEVQNPS